MDQIVVGFVWFVVLLFSLTVHEAAHAWAALRGGDATAYHGGQVTLDPIPHIRREPFGMILVPILMYALNGWMVGWASTPYNPVWARQHPKRAAWMSLAGPAANGGMVLVAAVAIRAGIAVGVFRAPEFVHFSQVTAAATPGVFETLATVVSLVFTLNLLLLVFNLIPAPPLDGSGAIGLLTSEAGARRIQEFMSQPGLAWGGILVAWFAIGPIFSRVHRVALKLLYPELSYG